VLSRLAQIQDRDPSGFGTSVCIESLSKDFHVELRTKSGRHNDVAWLPGAIVYPVTQHKTAIDE
jgi:hypothetical protein